MVLAGFGLNLTEPELDEMGDCTVFGTDALKAVYGIVLPFCIAAAILTGMVVLIVIFINLTSPIEYYVAPDYNNYNLSGSFQIF